MILIPAKIQVLIMRAEKTLEYLKQKCNDKNQYPKDFNWVITLSKINFYPALLSDTNPILHNCGDILMPNVF